MDDRPAAGEQTSVVDASEADDADTATSRSEAAASDERTTPSVPSDDQLGDVDETVKQQLEEAYLNDSREYLVVTDVTASADGRTISVSFQPPYGGDTHVERYPAPADGSMAAAEEFAALLDAAGVSPLEVEDLVGARVPASYDPEGGWTVTLPGSQQPKSNPGWRGWLPSLGVREWLVDNAKWILVFFLLVGELLFVLAILWIVV